jgi:hypothetical protein
MHVCVTGLIDEQLDQGLERLLRRRLRPHPWPGNEALQTITGITLRDGCLVGKGDSLSAPETPPIVVEALMDLKHNTEPWWWADVMFAYTHPFWKSIVPDLKMVLVVRHPLEVGVTLRKAPFGGQEVGENIELWKRYHYSALAFQPEDRAIVTVGDILRDGVPQTLERISNLLGVTAPSQIGVQDKWERVFNYDGSPTPDQDTNILWGSLLEEAFKWNLETG